MTMLQAVRMGGFASSHGKTGVNPYNEKIPSWEVIVRIMDEPGPKDEVSINFSSKGEN